MEEQYPRILANSDNGGVHFSFISDRDAAGKFVNFIFGLMIYDLCEFDQFFIFLLFS